MDIVNGAAYLFDKAPDTDNQHWKADLELEQFRKALEQDRWGIADSVAGRCSQK